jgi:hypothetical protein
MVYAVIHGFHPGFEYSTCERMLWWVLRRQNFERAENRAMMAEKFDSETLSLHVLSIP